MGERELEGKMRDGKKRGKKCCDFFERARGQVFLLMSLSFWFVLCFEYGALSSFFMCNGKKQKQTFFRREEERTKVEGVGFWREREEKRLNGDEKRRASPRSLPFFSLLFSEAEKPLLLSALPPPFSHHGCHNSSQASSCCRFVLARRRPRRGPPGAEVAPAPPPPVARAGVPAHPGQREHRSHGVAGGLCRLLEERQAGGPHGEHDAEGENDDERKGKGRAIIRSVVERH